MVHFFKSHHIRIEKYIHPLFERELHMLHENLLWGCLLCLSPSDRQYWCLIECLFVYCLSEQLYSQITSHLFSIRGIIEDTSANWELHFPSHYIRIAFRTWYDQNTFSTSRINVLLFWDWFQDHNLYFIHLIGLVGVSYFIEEVWIIHCSLIKSFFLSYLTSRPASGLSSWNGTNISGMFYRC